MREEHSWGEQDTLKLQQVGKYHTELSELTKVRVSWSTGLEGSWHA